MIDQIAPRFARYEPLRHAAELMAGMVSGLDRKNCWTIAEHRGANTPDGLQHLLARASWDADAVRDDLRDYVIEAFGDRGAILVVDETGDIKKGTHSVGVQRQYSGTAGRIENSQVAVYLTYAAPRGHALIDRALYLPRSWADDHDRCATAGIPHAQQAFATKPTLAATLIDRAVAAKVPAAWVAGDEVYGADPHLRAAIRGHGLGYVMAIAAYSWAWFRLLAEDGPDFGVHHLLIRRNDASGEYAYLRCYSPRPVPLRTLVVVAGQRWRIEESFQAAKGLVGLDQHQVRRWRSWHRWTTLAMLAHAFLAVATATERDTTPTPTGLITLTVNEFRRLFDALLLATNRTITSLLAWSRWRRQHQYRARRSHYRPLPGHRSRSGHREIPHLRPGPRITLRPGRTRLRNNRFRCSAKRRHRIQQSGRKPHHSSIIRATEHQPPQPNRTTRKHDHHAQI